MFTNSPYSVLARRARPIIFFGCIIAGLSIGASLLFPLEYRADAQMLIISKSRYGIDPYTVVKSAERVGENIAQVMKTNDFFQKVIDQPGYTYDKGQFGQLSERDKRKKWGKTVDGSVVYGTGVLNISVYQKNPDDAIQLAGAVADTLVSKGYEYVGNDVEIKIVNQPVATRFPVRPNLLLNGLAGLVGGVIFAGLMVLRRD